MLYDEPTVTQNVGLAQETPLSELSGLPGLVGLKVDTSFHVPGTVTAGRAAARAESTDTLCDADADIGSNPTKATAVMATEHVSRAARRSLNMASPDVGWSPQRQPSKTYQRQAPVFLIAEGDRGRVMLTWESAQDKIPVPVYWVTRPVTSEPLSAM